MPVEAIGAAAAAGGDEFAIELPQAFTMDGAPEAAAPGGEGFGSVLADQVGALQRTQSEAAAQSRALATGTAEDLPSVVMAVERAQLSMQLASQLRTKAVEAYQDVFRTQV
jgi:flagellar hook-basal body complex protein FliE